MDHKHSRKLWLINGLLLVTVLLGGWILYTRNSEQVVNLQVERISYALGNDVARDAPLDPFEEQLFGTGTTIKREYSQGPDTPSAWVLAVQTFQDRHAHHPPEYCYTGSGWQVIESGETKWSLPDGNHPSRFVVQRETDDHGYDRELVLTWFTDGERFTGSYMARTLWDAWDRITGRPKSWVMVRLSASLKENGHEAAKEGEARVEARLQSFAATFQQALHMTRPGNNPPGH
jgi:EpsI family protein